MNSFRVRNALWSLLFAVPFVAGSQTPGIGPDSVEAIAAKGFAAGSFHQSMFGSNYRDLWVLPVRVPVLHITQFEGGLTPYRIGGGKQTRSLRMVTSDSAEYAFRPVYKHPNLPEDFQGTWVWKIFRDVGSASHPAANVAPVPVMESFGFLHPNARLVFMPDDPALGEYRKEFGGVLGTLEAYPTKPVVGRAFANAVSVLDAEDLLEAIDKDVTTQVDARTLLKVRLIDMWLGDNDRHADQWRWARLAEGGLYQPIARDRDKVFVSYSGTMLSLARMMFPSLVAFDSAMADPTALFENATNFDRRLLAGLDKSVWESAAHELRTSLTDELIDKALAAMPREYGIRTAELSGKLRARREQLPQVALTYYAKLWQLAELHGTDTAEVATITRQSDGSVDVAFRSGSDSAWLRRHFDPADTREIRVYLHGGDDNATITGNANASIPVRVIGGNGNNTIVDQSVVGGRSNTTKLYDLGNVTTVEYGKDPELEEYSYVDALNQYYNRRPLVRAWGTMRPQHKDYGAKIQPVFGLKTGHGLGLVPMVGIARYTYGFRKYPYASMIQADVAFSTGTQGWKANLIFDKRFASSDFHIPAIATMSQLEVIQFRGFGNDVEEDESPFFDVKQTQWSFNPSLGYTFARKSDFTIGPIVRTTRTDSVGFLAVSRPLGFPRYSQAGVRAGLRFDSRVRPDTGKIRVVMDFAGSAYPAVWDVESAYQSIEGEVLGFINIPVLTKPVIALRAGGKKLYGDFPYFDAAFLGGGSSFRTEHRQRFAGDAAAYGSAELRVPLFRFSTLVPTDVGVIGFTDAGRVYVDGESPGGWHTATGAGFWVGGVNAKYNVNVLFTNSENKPIVVTLGFAY